MSLVRDLGMTLTAMEDTILATCSYYLTTAGSTSPVVKNMLGTADAIVTTGGAAVFSTAFGRVIDRIGAPLGTLYNVALPAAIINSTIGSTEANRAIQIGIKLQHGDSSGAGDMADYSTGSQPADRTYFGTGRTTDMLAWETGGRSTGAFQGTSNPAYYDLSGAKRYIRTAVRVCLPQRTATTESTGEEQSRIAAVITFLGAADIPQPTDSRLSPISTATSTI